MNMPASNQAWPTNLALRSLGGFLLLATVTLAGCADNGDFEHALSSTSFAVPDDLTGAVAASDLTWPDLAGAKLRILDHGAFPACEDAGAIFENLTGARVECTSEADTGSALQRAVLGKGDPEFDVLYGVDNALLRLAIEEDVLQPYTPRLAPRVSERAHFFSETPWPATPVDQGYIALNIDPSHEGFPEDGGAISDLFAVRDHADLFVTQDPRLSTPGLGFLLITIDVFGQDDAYDWKDYWTELFARGVKVTPDWTTAYATHFSGGYGVYTEGHIGDRPIVTSYTESPAAEVYFETFASIDEAADVLLAHQGQPAAFHQVQTMGILRGTPNRVVAEAWIEFTLTDDFQAFAAPYNAVYPAVDAFSTQDVYGDMDPEPGTFDVTRLSYAQIGAGLDGWLAEWTALCEAHDCA